MSNRDRYYYPALIISHFLQGGTPFRDEMHLKENPLDKGQEYTV